MWKVVDRGWIARIRLLERAIVVGKHMLFSKVKILDTYRRSFCVGFRYFTVYLCLIHGEHDQFVEQQV